MLNKLLSIPKIIYVNFRYLPFKYAIYFPISVSYNTKFRMRRKSKIVFNCPLGRNLISVGIASGSFEIGKHRGSSLTLDEGAILEINGKTVISRGGNIHLDSAAKMIFGKNFVANANFLCVAADNITFGDDTLIGWDCTVIDGDGHAVSTNSLTLKRINKPIHVGNHVWLGAHSSVLKGSTIKDGSVIGFGAVVTGKSYSSNSLLVGANAREISSSIQWDY